MKPKQSTAKDTIRVLKKLDFKELATGATSHAGYRHEDGRKVTVSCHPGDIPTGTLREMIKAMGISVQKYNEMV